MTKYLDTFLGPDTLDQVFCNSDLVIVFGFEMGEDLSPALFQRGIPKTVVRVEDNTVNMDQPLAYDYHLILDRQEKFFHLVGDSPKSEDNLKVAQLIRDRKQMKTTSAEERFVNPFLAIKKLNEFMEKDDILISDVGMHKHIAGVFFNTERVRGYQGSNGLATMGFGLPAAIGAKLANPKDKVVLVCGDGGFHSVSQELATCALLEIPILILLFRNSTYHLIQHYQRKGFGKHESNTTRFAIVDFVKLAEANGCLGHDVHSAEDLELALGAFEKESKTTLIQVNTDYDYFI